MKNFDFSRDGLCFSLSYEGMRGWRLKISALSDMNYLSASESLARFLGEPSTGEAEDIITADGLEVIESCGSRVILSASGTAMKFISPEGRVITEILSVSLRDGDLVIEGALEPAEAIYGGGERFDRINKRGTTVPIYICDGWNNSGTSYMAIPLFLTTRGGGMFFDSYRTASFDAGESSSDEWSFTHEGDSLDCYFYATGDMTAALRGYTELAGHAYMPTPWMQGVAATRYAMDYYYFDRDLGVESYRDIPELREHFVKMGEEYIPVSSLDEAALEAAEIFCTLLPDGKYKVQYIKNDAGELTKAGPKGNPSGQSVKTLIEKGLSADMKPDAAVLECVPWLLSFEDSDAGRERREDLRRSVEYLHAHGIRAMLYMRVGDIRSICRGYKEEYHVHADVEITEADGSITVNENTTRIPWLLGTAANPDVRNTSGTMRTTDYLDITNDEAVEWYFDGMWRELVELGIDGIKIDFCEVMPDSGRQIGSVKTTYRWKNPDRIPVGQEHHAYATFFISLFYKKALEHRARIGLDDGFMLLSRGGGIGSQRSPYMWAGDQARRYDKLDDLILAVLTSGASGVPYMSYDLAGYAYVGCNYKTIGKERESQIFARGVEFAAFMTQIQSHGDVRHPFEMTDSVQDIYRAYMALHHELIPYMQEYSRIACDTGVAPVRHLGLMYPSDTATHSIFDEFMLGDGLLVAPIITEDTYEREVYLPSGRWTELLTGESLDGGRTVTAKASLGQIPLYLSEDSADAAELRKIFAGLTWSRIKGMK